MRSHAEMAGWLIVAAMFLGLAARFFYKAAVGGSVDRTGDLVWLGVVFVFISLLHIAKAFQDRHDA